MTLYQIGLAFRIVGPLNCDSTFGAMAKLVHQIEAC